MVAFHQHPSPVNEASLIDPSLHSPALMEMLETELSRPLIEYVVDCVVETVGYAMGRPSSSTRGRSYARQTEHTKFAHFVADVLRKAEVKVPALLVTLVYIDRAKPHLQIALEQWACERVFLGALILANKYLNDSTLKNVHWALCTGVFGKRDIGRIEREFLDVLDFQLGITEDDILAHHGAILSITRPHLRITLSGVASTRPSLQYDSSSSARTSPKSHWSSDSSDSDSLSSVESSSPPHTPAHPTMDVDASYVSPSKHAEYLTVPTVVRSPSKPAKESSHRRLSSAFQLLRSFPLPQFNHSRQSSSSTTSSSTLVSSTQSSTTSLSIPSANCKSGALAHAHVVPRAASLVV